MGIEEPERGGARGLGAARFPVQYVIRPPSGLHLDYRCYAGSVAGGVFRPGDRIVVLPSGATSTIAAIRGPGGGEVAEAFPPMAVSLQLADELDVSRGDMLCHPDHRPRTERELTLAMRRAADDDGDLDVGTIVLLRHTTRATRARVLEVNPGPATDVARVRLRTQTPLMVDDHRRNPVTGTVLLLDALTGAAIGVGLIDDRAPRGAG